ncbi:rod shape-determining protein MreC [Patescibacteria group bacterium]
MAKKSLLKPIILSILIISLLIFVNGRGWIDKPKDYFFNLIGPVQNFFYSTFSDAHSSISFFVSLKSVMEENIELRDENQLVLGKLVQFNEVVRENEILKEQLNLSIDEERQLVLASIIGQDLYGDSKHLFINRGSKDGIEDKMAVVASGNILIGKVVEAMDSFSKVQLITDGNIRVNAIIQGSEIIGLVHGEEGNIIIDFISQGENIEDDDFVITSGLAGVFPMGLLIGKIKKVVSNDAQVFQKAKIDPIINFLTLKKVFVIKN